LAPTEFDIANGEIIIFLVFIAFFLNSKKLSVSGSKENAIPFSHIQTFSQNDDHSEPQNQLKYHFHATNFS
jgi:hypothetical protein